MIVNKTLLSCMDIMQPTRKQEAQIEIYDIFNWGGFSSIRMFAIFQGNLAAERNNVLSLPSI